MAERSDSSDSSDSSASSASSDSSDSSASSASSDSSGRSATSAGPGRAMVAVYAVFSVAAVSRAAVQIATKFDEARLAYLLSALAGAVYVVATVALTRTGPTWRRVAWFACGLELVGVLTVGTLSLADSEAFGDQAVWSAYGAGYLFVPLVLPVLGLAWLRRSGRPQQPRPESVPAP